MLSMYVVTFAANTPLKGRRELWAIDVLPLCAIDIWKIAYDKDEGIE